MPVQLEFVLAPLVDGVQPLLKISGSVSGVTGVSPRTRPGMVRRGWAASG